MTHNEVKYMEWQPIETAPINIYVLVFCDDIKISVQNAGLLGQKRSWVDDAGWKFHPTHWMPLPEAPKP